jgi:long-chain fatty acid transport protein
MLALLALSPAAHAASLDLLEVGGAFGTPAATNPTALWFNPAGLAVGGGTQFFAEGAPALATVNATRTNPDYGELPTPLSPEFPTEYDYSGTEKLTFTGVVPFLGVSSDLGVKGLGIGLGMMAPTGVGARTTAEDGPNRYQMREGAVQTIHFVGGAAYQLKDKVALGAAFTVIDGSYYANLDTTTYPDLAWAVADELGATAPPPSFQDGYAENLGYATTTIFGGEKPGGGHGRLKDLATTFSLGLHVTPLKKERLLDVAVSYNHGYRLDTEGDLTLRFRCPPSYDGISRFGAETAGLCNPDTGEGSVVQGTGKIGFDLPGRVQFGVSSSPVDRLRLEVMGAYVFWSVFTDYDITTVVTPDAIPAANPEDAEQSAELVSQERKWARDNRDTFWVGVDGKYMFSELFGAGARVIYDRSAIPDQVVSPNNFDANQVMLTGVLLVNPIDRIGIGLSAGHYFLATRTVTDSPFGVNIAQANPDAEDYYGASPEAGRYFFPGTNGTYQGSISRFGLSVRGVFGRKDGLPIW